MLRVKTTIAILFAASLCATVPAKAQLIGGNYVKGANLPWLDGHYSYYLGVDPHNPSYGCAYNSGSMNAHFADMHNMGITVVRLWINQSDQGCTIDGSGNTTGVTSLFWTNLDDTVRLAGNNGIKLYLTLNNGRADFLTNGALLNNYINNALKPLIQRYKGDSRIWAIDAMNEIDGVVGGPDGNYGSGPSWSQAQSYIRSIVSAVHSVDPGRLVSCSTGWHTWNNLGYFKGQGLDFYDFHLYNDNGYIPTASSLGMDKPVYVGETGQSTNSWNDSLQNTEMANILSNSNNGYAGIGIWDYDYAGSTDIHTMLYANGSWRPVCNTIKNFTYTGGGSSNLIANGTYTIVNKNSGMALDDPGGSTADSTAINQWSVNGGSNQRWQLTNLGGNVVELINVASGKALDVTGASTTAGALIDQYTWGNNAWQKWNIVSMGSGYYKITSNYSGLALDVASASTTAGASVDQWTWSGNANQLWKFQ
ncbi:MAG: RICIN domain-containing protein [Capsulimonas sp.]|uniref:RICIN domain-containing protein n=1 Tax=Capsulimonas sp. TaxID=2494211 RepID=UPI0032636090